MKTLSITQYGDPNVLDLVESATPEPGPGEVRVLVEAAAVNPVDVALRAGYLAPMIGEPFPLGFGWDVAGTIDAVGSEVSLEVGTSVIGLLDVMVTPSGTHASHVILPATAVAPAPAGADAIAASTLPLNSLTADQALDLLALKKGETVVVTGAAGAVGEYAVSIAAHQGFEVIAVASKGDEASVRAAGASHFISRDDDLVSGVRAITEAGADGLLDAAQLADKAIGAVRDGGSFVAVTDPSIPVAERGIAVSKVSVHHDGARLAEFAQAVEDGWLRLRVAESFSLDDAAKAHDVAATPGLRGKVVLIP